MKKEERKVMKYFMFIDGKIRRHIIAAGDIDEAQSIAERAGLEKRDLYELQADTFTDSGFLISDK